MHDKKIIVLQISKTTLMMKQKKHDDEACGEIETAHPDYLNSQTRFMLVI